MWQLYDAGLIEAVDATTSDGFQRQPHRLTWAGHGFLDAARNDPMWNKARTAGATGGLVFDPLKAVLIDEAKRQIGSS